MNRHLNKHFFSSSVSKVNLNASKSWKITIAAIIVAIAMNIMAGPLNGIGFVVDEATLTNLVYMALGIGATGAGLKGIKTTKAAVPKIIPEEVFTPIVPSTTGAVEVKSNSATTLTEKNGSTITIPTVEAAFEVPTLLPIGSKYKTNFTKHAQKGNVILYGQSYLWVQIVGARSYVTAILKDAKQNIIQIDQSHQNDEDGDITTTRLELFSRDGTPLPRGQYFLEYRGDSGSSDSIGISNDKFEIC